MNPTRTLSSPEEVIDAAERLLAQGKTDEGRELLLNRGYVVRSEPLIQKAYVRLVPVGVTLQAVLDEVYPGLDDPSPKVQFDAATTLAREFTKTYPRDKVRWMRDPRASEPLIRVVQDADPKVSARALRALSCLVCRYFADQRALPTFVGKLADAKQDIRNDAISGIGCLRHEEGLEHLIGLNDGGTEVDRAEVARQVAGLAYASVPQVGQYPMAWSDGGREFWKRRMAAATRDASAGVRKQAVFALKGFGDRRMLPELKAARQVEQDKDLLFYLDDAIAALEKGA